MNEFWAAAAAAAIATRISALFHHRTFKSLPFRAARATSWKKIFFPFFPLLSLPAACCYFLVQSHSLLKRQLNIMQVICIIHWTNPGSNMQIEIMGCWLAPHFASPIDSAELEARLFVQKWRAAYFWGRLESAQVFFQMRHNLDGGIPWCFFFPPRI